MSLEGTRKDIENEEDPIMMAVRRTEIRDGDDELGGTEPTDDLMQASSAAEEERAGEGTEEALATSETTQPPDIRPIQDEKHQEAEQQQQEQQVEEENPTDMQPTANVDTQPEGDDEDRFPILIDDFSRTPPYFPWTIQNDTSIGGSSTATWALRDGHITFSGHINATIADGVAKLTAHPEHDNNVLKFPDVSSCLGFQLLLRRTNPKDDYSGYTLIFVDPRAPNAHDEHGAGYMARLRVPTNGNSIDWTTVQIPFTAFTDSWNHLINYTKDTFVCHDEFCPGAESLFNMDRVTISAMYKSGDFSLDIKLLGAYGCTDRDSLTPYTDWPSSSSQSGMAEMEQVLWNDVAVLWNTVWAVVAGGIFVIVVGACCIHCRRQRDYANHSKLMQADFEDAWDHTNDDDDIELI